MRTECVSPPTGSDSAAEAGANATGSGSSSGTCLRYSFMFSREYRSDGSQRMLRLPSGRGPNAIGPWNHATTLPCARSFDVRSIRRSQSGS